MDEAACRLYDGEPKNGTIYTGVTGSLVDRVYHHKEGRGSTFTKKYGCKILVYYESHQTFPDAIAREKQIKAGSRKAKLHIIQRMNPDWRDLYQDFV